MATIQIYDTDEAKIKLSTALKTLDAVHTYSINHNIPTDRLFSEDVRRRLESLYAKAPTPPRRHPILETFAFDSKDVEALSESCYKIENTTDFDAVLLGLEAHLKQTNIQSNTSKGELIDSIIRGGISKTVRSSVASIIDVVGSLALWQIREVEAKTLATERRHAGISTQDKSDAATLMWKYLSRYSTNASREKLNIRIQTGSRWSKFSSGKDIGLIVAVHKLPPSLKPKYAKLSSIVYALPQIEALAKKATPCVQQLLDARLLPWTECHKTKPSAQRLGSPNPKRQRCHNVKEGHGSALSSTNAFTQPEESEQTQRQQDIHSDTNESLHSVGSTQPRISEFIHQQNLNTVFSPQANYLERGLYSDTNSTAAAETLAHLRQTSTDDAQHSVCNHETRILGQLSEQNHPTCGSNGPTLDMTTREHPLAPFNYDSAHDPSDFSFHFPHNPPHNPPEFPFDYASAYDPSSFSTNYNNGEMGLPAFQYVAEYDPFASTTSFPPPSLST